MASRNKEGILSQAFHGSGASGLTAPDLATIIQNLLPQNLPDALTNTSKQLDQLRTVSQAQSDAVGQNTQAVSQNTVAHSSGGVAGVASTIGKAASSILGGGLELVPLISGIAHLFSGGKPEPPPPLIKFSLPPNLHFEAASAPSGGIQNADYNQQGQSRGYEQSPSSQQTNSTTGSQSSPTEINIHVQAMDSRSFLDHSHEIAQAVREAMLNMHSINDVVNDL